MDMKTTTMIRLATVAVSMVQLMLLRPNSLVWAAPEQGHLALTDAGMSITWVEKASRNPSADFNVQYGLSPDKLDRTSAPANVTTYTIDEMCGAPANESSHWVEPGRIFHAEMILATYAKPGSTVYYNFGSDVRSPVYHFTYGTKSPTKTSFIAYGDMGLRGSYHNSTEEILAHLDDVDFVLHIGDISCKFCARFCLDYLPTAHQIVVCTYI